MCEVTLVQFPLRLSDLALQSFLLYVVPVLSKLAENSPLTYPK